MAFMPEPQHRIVGENSAQQVDAIFAEGDSVCSALTQLFAAVGMHPTNAKANKWVSHDQNHPSVCNDGCPSSI